MHRKSREILPSHMQLLTYLLEYTVRARIMHTFLLPLYGSIFLPSVFVWIQLPRVEPQKSCNCQTSQHISACKLFATFFIQVSAVTAPLSSLASRLQHVSGSKHEHVRGTWSAYQSTDVSVVQKRMKTISKNRKVVSACHVGLKLHVGQDDWPKHGICILLWQLIWTFVLFVSETVCTVKKYCRNRKLAESCQTVVGICLVAARFVSSRRSA